MSIILLAGRKKAMATKQKKIVRKVGKVDKSGEAEITTAWTISLEGKDVKISFSRDTMFVYVDDIHTECTAYITDNGFDLDLIFNVDDHRGHIYSDVEGNEMTNYLFVDDELRAQQKVKNCQSKHQKS